MYLDGTEFTEDEEQRFPKDVYNYLDYNQHLVPLYKLSGQLLRQSSAPASVPPPLWPNARRCRP